VFLISVIACCKSSKEAGSLVEGAGDVFICGECVELCRNILTGKHRKCGEEPLGKEVTTHQETMMKVETHLYEANRKIDEAIELLRATGDGGY